MGAAAAEEAGRLDAEVAELLLAAVDDRVQEGRLHLVSLRFYALLLLRAQLLLLLRLLLEVRRDQAEVALFEMLDLSGSEAASQG